MVTVLHKCMEASHAMLQNQDSSEPVKGADQTKRAGCKGNVDGCMVTIACVLGYWLEVGAQCDKIK